MARTELEIAERDLIKAHRDSLKLAQRRADCDPGTSRARITTANAKWSRAAEHRDRLAAKVDDLGGDSIAIMRKAEA